MLAEMCRLAYVDPRDLFTAAGKLQKFRKLDANTARAIAGVTFNDYGGVKSVRLIDKKGALDSLMRHLGLFDKDKVALTDPDGGPLGVRVVFVDAPAPVKE